MGRSILVCDSEPAARSNLRAMLLELGYEEVMECAEGTTALEMALAAFPDIALLDVALPGMNGIETAGEIRKKLKIPLILQMQECDAPTVKHATECGVAAFLNKPVRKQDLLAAMETAMRHVEEVEELKEKIEDLRETIENRKIIEKAKGMLMENKRIPEAEAYRVMQRKAMDSRRSMRQVAETLLKSEGRNGG